MDENERISSVLNPINKMNDSMLILAARNGNLPRLQSICSKIGVQRFRKIAENHANKLGKTVLHESAQHEQVPVVEFLLFYVKMDPDCLKQGDWTPLMLACTKCNAEIVKHFPKAGADLNLRNKDGWSPFHIACREGKTEILSLFLDFDADLWKTCSKNGRTPLHTAAMYGRAEAVTFLINKCPFPENQQDSCGSTPLMDALKSGHVEIARDLIKNHQADPAISDILGRQAIHLAAETGRPDSVAFLVQECKVSVNAVCKCGQSPAHFAAKEGQLCVLRLLKSLNADFQKTDNKHGRSALHLASGGQHAHSVHFLLEEAKVNDFPDKCGKLAENYAVKPEVKTAFKR